MQNKYNDQTVISVTGPIQGQHLSLTLPWDANAEEWVDAFKTILTHQTFAPQTIAEIFGEAELILQEEIEGSIRDFLKQNRPTHSDRTYSEQEYEY